jgi:hypothetical protein
MRVPAIVLMGLVLSACGSSSEPSSPFRLPTSGRHRQNLPLLMVVLAMSVRRMEPASVREDPLRHCG